MNAKTLLITGAGSGLAEAAALGIAKAGHRVIATVQVSPQATPLREKARALGLDNLEVRKLDLLDPYDVAAIEKLATQVDVLWSNAGIGEAGPVFEIPVDLVRRNYEVNVFAPLALTQSFVTTWIRAGQKGKKVVFTSSMGGLFTPANWGPYVSTKHVLEAIAEAMQQELAPYGLKVQTINPGAYYTGFNETMADTPFRWLDDAVNITKREALRAEFDGFFATPAGKMDAQEMVARMIEIVPADEGRFRNVVPQAVEDMLKQHQVSAWENRI